MLKEEMKQPENLQPINLGAVDQRKVGEKTTKVNSVTDRIPCQNIGEYKYVDTNWSKHSC